MCFASYLMGCSSRPPTLGRASEGLNLGSYLRPALYPTSLPVVLRDRCQGAIPFCISEVEVTPGSDLIHPCTSSCLLKKSTQQGELCFSHGLTEACSPGDSLSGHCSREVRKRPVCTQGFGAGKYLHSSLLLDKILLLITKNRYLKLLILVLF